MASQGIKQVLSFLTPPPLIVPEDYDGLEYRWKFLVFRPGREYISLGIRCCFETEIVIVKVFQKEALFLLATLLYLAWYFVGKSYNVSRANKW